MNEKMTYPRRATALALTKVASRLEQKLIAQALKKGLTVSLATASKATGRTYPRGFGSLNELLDARRRFFTHRVVPLLQRRSAILRSAVPLSEVTPAGSPVFRGVTRFRNGSHYINGIDFADDVWARLSGAENPSLWGRLVDRLQFRRYFTGVPEVAFLYADGHNGTRWLRVADMSTPAGRWAVNHGVVTSTPRIDMPMEGFRRKVRQMVDSGELVPARDLSTGGRPLHPLHTRVDNEMRIPAWLRPLIKEKSYRLVPTVQGSKGARFVVPVAEGRKLDSLERKLDRLTLGGEYRYKYGFRRAPLSLRPF